MLKPSDFELKLLRHVWRDKRLSAREIHDASQTETGWSFSATRKTLERMVEKDLIAIEMVHGLKTFVARQSKLETLAALVSDFARNVLDSTEPMPAATFAHSRMISQDEVAELETLLEKLADKDAQS